LGEREVEDFSANIIEIEVHQPDVLQLRLEALILVVQYIMTTQLPERGDLVVRAGDGGDLAFRVSESDLRGDETD